MTDNYQDQNILTEVAKFLKLESPLSLIDIHNQYNIPEDQLQMIYNVIRNRIYPIYWIKNNVTVQHPNLGPVPFNLYKFQENIIKIWLAKHFIITLKSRQVGMSTVAQATCLWAALNYKNYNILILSARDRNATKFLDDIKKMYDSIPNDNLKIDTVTRNEHTLSFANGSKIQALPATSDSARGLSINLLIIDEAAFIQNIDAVYQSTYPVISRAFPKEDKPNQKPFGVIIISTPYGVSGVGKWYYDMYTGAVSGKNPYVPVRIHWKQIPEFDEKWYVDQCKNLNYDYKKIMSELELSFVSSGDTYIPNEILDTIAIQQPIYRDTNKNLWIWEEPQPNETYLMGVDVAFGTKKDSSVIQIIKASTLEQVAEYENNSIIVQDYSDVVINLCKLYKNHVCNIENNSLGKILIDDIITKTNFVGINLFRDVNPGDILLKPGQYPTNKDQIGTKVTGANRDTLLSNMQEILLKNYNEALADIINQSEDDNDPELAKKNYDAMHNRGTNIVKKYGIIKSERLLNQLLGFVRTNSGKVEGDHDDLVMAYVHALWCYSKWKPYLVSNTSLITSNGLNGSDKLNKMRSNIEFMQRGNSIWNSYNANDLAKSMLEEEEIEDQMIAMANQDKKQNNNGAMNKAVLFNMLNNMR